MRNAIACGAALAFAWLPTTHAHAQPVKYKNADYVACDGVWKPTKTSDELDWPQQDKRGLLLRDDIAQYGEAGLKACDFVLGDPMLTGALNNRRANLLVYKATHLVALGRYTDALQSLDEAAALQIAKDDRVYAESIGMRATFVRAFALAKLGKSAEAVALADSITGLRPYAPSVSVAAILLARSVDHDIDKYVQQLGTTSHSWPASLNTMFWMQLGQRKYSLAADTAELIEFAIPKNRGGWQVAGEDEEALRQIIERAELYGARAYALSVAGREADSDAQFAANRLQTIAATPTLAPEKQKSRRAVEEYELQKKVVDAALKRIDKWQEALKLRVAAQSQTADTVIDWAKKTADMPSVALFDLFGQLPAPALMALNLPEGNRNPAEAFKSAAAKTIKFEFGDLVQLSAMPESVKTIPKIRRAGEAIMRVDNGYSRSPRPGSDLQTIRYHNTQAGRDRVEEIGLLAAAMYAEVDGKDSILILSRRTLQRASTMSSIYGSNTFYDGFETQMVALLTNADALPPEHAAQRARLISVGPILAELRPRFDIKELPKKLVP
jgi:tetratricopeptide (TPR) repeat protein